MNTIFKKRVKLKAVPKSIVSRGRSVEGKEFVITSTIEFDEKDSSGLFAIEFIDLSKFPVVIGDAGFIAAGYFEHMTMPNPMLMDDGNWPRKSEAREAVTIYGNLENMFDSQLGTKYMLCVC